MMYGTLNTIAKLLEEEINVRTRLLENARKNVNQLEQAKEENKDEFNPDDLEYWEERKKACIAALTEVRESRADFLQHDWH